MNCPECEIIEMRLEKVINDEFFFKCKKCGKEVIKKEEELEDE